MMNIKIFKILIPFLSIAFVLLLFSIFNTIVARGEKDRDYKYKNELSKNIIQGKVSDIDYDYISKDLDDVDKILKESLSNDKDIKKKTEYYKEAQNVYDRKINEINAILNEKLDDEDFGHLQENLDEFYKNLDAASEEIKVTIKSTVDSLYNIYKYQYEEKQMKCREILEEYKGFLSKK